MSHLVDSGRENNDPSVASRPLGEGGDGEEELTNVKQIMLAKEHWPRIRCVLSMDDEQTASLPPP